MSGLIKLTTLGVALLVASTLFGASAFTTASVERDVSVTVQNDENGLLALTDGTSGPLIDGTDTNELAIDLSAGSSGSGPNVDASFGFGDAELADDGWDTDEYAFSLTNNGGTATDVTMSFTPDAGDANSDDNVRFLVYDSSGSLEETVSDETAKQSATLSFTAGESKYIVLIIDTPEGASTVGTSYDGSLDFTVGSPPSDA